MRTIVMSCSPSCSCDHELSRLVELAGLSEAVSVEDLQAKYDRYNRELFDGQLPKIPITSRALKHVGGVVKWKIMRTGPAPNPTMVRLGRVSKYAGMDLVPGSLTMTINSAYKRSDQGLDAILIHEMLHVYFAAVEKDFGESHGPRFREMVRDLSAKVGFEIPLTDDTADLDLENGATPYGVLIVDRGRVLISLMTEKVALGMSEEDFLKRVEGYRGEATLLLVKSDELTKFALNYPVTRSASAKTKFFSFTTPDKSRAFVADAREHGKVLFTR